MWQKLQKLQLFFEKLQFFFVKFTNVHCYFFLFGFFFCELAKFHHIKKHHTIKLLGLNSVLALKRSLDRGSSVNWALFPSKKAEELLGFSPIFPPICLTKLQRRKNLQLPQSVLIYWKNLKNWVFPNGR